MIAELSPAELSAYVTECDRLSDAEIHFLVKQHKSAAIGAIMFFALNVLLYGHRWQHGIGKQPHLVCRREKRIMFNKK